jgi:hypothetical protein
LLKRVSKASNTKALFFSSIACVISFSFDIPGAVFRPVDSIQSRFYNVDHNCLLAPVVASCQEVCCPSFGVHGQISRAHWVMRLFGDCLAFRDHRH